MKKDKSNIKILVAYHRPFDLLKSNILTPIHVGRDIATNTESKSWLEKNMLGDNTGDNISYKNKNYCELTALYWAWKNLDSDYLGLFHYRRMMSFKDSISQIYSTDKKFLKKIGLDDNTIEKMCEKYDVILPPVYNVHPIGQPKNIMSNYEFYANEHNKSDMDAMINIIKEYYPEYIPDTENYLSSKKSFFFNMFVMRKDIYNQYMEFLFGVMDKLEKIISISENSYQARVFGFLSERLQNIFIYHVKRTNPDIKIHYVQDIVYYAPSCKPVKFEKKNLNLGEMQYLSSSQNTANNEINIVFSIDGNYAKHCAATLCSILLNSKRGNKFNIFILDGGISQKIKNKFEKLKEIRDFNLNYISIDNEYFKDLPLNRSYISIATYYRLLLPEVLPSNIDKVIYLDSDIIVEKDIAELWNYDISDKYAAVVEDEGSIYQVQRMHLPAKNSYFNAGVCMFNIKKLREFDFQKMWKEYFEKNKEIITLQDQDILNGVFNGNCLFVPLQWNANGRLYTKHNLMEHNYSHEEAVYAAHNPGILHFTDINKPWNKLCTHPLKSEYLKYLSLTPWHSLALKYRIEQIICFFLANTKKYRRNIIQIHLNKHEHFIKIFHRKYTFKKGEN